MTWISQLVPFENTPIVIIPVQLDRYRQKARPFWVQMRVDLFVNCELDSLYYSHNVVYLPSKNEFAIGNILYGVTIAMGYLTRTRVLRLFLFPTYLRGVINKTAVKFPNTLKILLEYNTRVLPAYTRVKTNIVFRDSSLYLYDKLFVW